jgi:CRISPR-associated protein Csx10
MVYSAAQLQAQTGLEATLIRSQATYGIIGGWNVSWDRPKATMLSANAGSVYLFRTQASLDDIADALSQLEKRGIGERRQEGYGAVRGCDEFHLRATKEVV